MHSSAVNFRQLNYKGNMYFGKNPLPNNSKRNVARRVVMIMVLGGGESFLPVFLIGGGEDVRHRRHVRIGQHEAEQQATCDLVPAQADGLERVIDDVHHGGGDSRDFEGKTKKNFFFNLYLN